MMVYAVNVSPHRVAEVFGINFFHFTKVRRKKSTTISFFLLHLFQTLCVCPSHQRLAGFLVVGIVASAWCILSTCLAWHSLIPNPANKFVIKTHTAASLLLLLRYSQGLAVRTIWRELFHARKLIMGGPFLARCVPEILQRQARNSKKFV